MKLLPSLVALTLLSSACLGGSTQITPAPGTPTAASTTTAAASSPAAGAPSGAGGAPTALPAARLAALNGTRCVGQWKNATTSTSGALAIRLEVGGAGGVVHWEIGGPVFGGQGGTFDAPFRLVGEIVEIEAHSDWLGHMSARIGLDGKTTATLQEVPPLGLKSMVTVTNAKYVANKLTFNLKVEPNDGSPNQSASVEAACTRS